MKYIVITFYCIFFYQSHIFACQPSKKTIYSYQIVKRQNCSYCKKERMLVPCTWCAQRFLPEALKKYGNQISLGDENPPKQECTIYELLEELDEKKSRTLNTVALLTSAAELEIINEEGLRTSRDSSVLFYDRAFVLSTLEVEKRDDQLTTISFSPLGKKPTNKPDSVPLLAEKTKQDEEDDSSSCCCLPWK